MPSRSDPFSVRMNPRAKEQVREAIFHGVQELFELDIKPEAQALSPARTGTNRRSIDVEVTQTPEGPRALLFTQSGYGGYLELGTRFMQAQPYLYPAVKKYIGKLSSIVGRRIRLIPPSGQLRLPFKRNG